MIFMGFHGFYHENRLVGNFHHYIYNQRVEIRKYGEFEGNRRIHLFGTAPVYSKHDATLIKILFF